MALWEYLWAWSDVTKWLYHLNWNANDDSWNGKNWTASNVSRVGWKVGSWAASFNGSSSYCRMPTPLSATDNFTTMCWVYISWTNIKWWFLSNSNYVVSLTQSPQLWYSLWIWNTTWDNTWNNFIIIANSVSVVWKVNSIWVWRHHFGVIRSSWNWYPIFDWVIYPSTASNNMYAWTITDLFLWVVSPVRITPSERRWFPWLIDEVIIENRVRTAEEIQKYYTYASWKFGIQ